MVRAVVRRAREKDREDIIDEPIVIHDGKVISQAEAKARAKKL